MRRELITCDCCAKDSKTGKYINFKLGIGSISYEDLCDDCYSKLDLFKNEIHKLLRDKIVSIKKEVWGEEDEV